MTVEEKIELLEEIMDYDEGELSLDMVLDDMEEWDSLAKLSLMAISKKRFEKRLTTDEIRGFVTVSDICDYLQ